MMDEDEYRRYRIEYIAHDLEETSENANSMHPPLFTSSCCMYKVPQKLRTINEEAYTPTFISIGPFYYEDPRFFSMQNFKIWFFNQFLKMNPEKGLRDYVEALYGLDDEIRGCYSEHISYSYITSGIFIDAGFIIGFFMANTAVDDLSRLKPGITSNLMLDLILLENQIPFFVLERLYQVCSPTSNVSTFLEIAFNKFVSTFLKNMYPRNHQIFGKFSYTYFEENHLKLPSGEIHQVQHLCDLLRTFYVPSKEQRGLDTEMKRSYGVSQLKGAGIEFQADHARSIIEVRSFDQVRRLNMPSIKINDWTEIMLRNVVAFEQRHHSFMHYVTDYIIFLDCLINTENDVEVLVEKGIIENWVANDKVAVMVNKLCHNVTVRNINSNYTKVYRLLTQVYDKPYYKNKATFMGEYWSTPWKRLSLLGGILLLFLTFIQTTCSVIPLFMKK